MASSGFHRTDPLLCPHCRYDLAGIPDGPCPECGQVFSAAKLREARETTSRRGELRLSDLTLLFGSALVLSLWFVPLGRLIYLPASRGSDEHFAEAVVLVALWIVCLAWFVAMRRHAPDRYGSLLWLVIPFARTAWSLIVVPGHTSRFVAAAGLAVALAMLSVPMRRHPRRTVWTMVVALCLPVAIVGSVIVASGLENRHRPMVWSEWADPRTDPGHINRPLRYGEAVGFGLRLTVPAIILVGLAAATFRWAWRRELDATIGETSGRDIGTLGAPVSERSPGT